MNEKVANRQQRAKVQSMMNVACVAQEIGCTADMIRKLRDGTPLSLGVLVPRVILLALGTCWFLGGGVVVVQRGDAGDGIDRSGVVSLAGHRATSR